ncbi:MAG: 2-oxoacid:ferredoxin oxidoreductase subunit beta [Calditrichaeota bacterium]|nr:MAG: 2-oxoacid:ferredoxin oxidoreductase subunit beta [Calditrichota bacterium]MBL1204262.1 2-oxoacid:ferredoxin oxidoreductase subunit beta [Calditrichota bacterium]NOG44092.1 2-oxoacid:ferredoxin oxidoreductase subunit beta [Calditrichota bacterium]
MPENVVANQNVSKLTKKDFTSDQEVRWCPGCGDYSILAQTQKVLPELGIPKENIVFVSGIGCSSRFPYYIDSFGIHGIHGRAPAIASGIKLANSDLKVFIVTGDGDGLSIGGNHLIHLFRRNLDVTVLLFNNRIYGLTKGQYSPTSERGKITKSSPYGSLENPFNPVKVALAAGATFVARSIDREPKHLADIIKRASEHTGTSFVEIYQNCNIFNDGTFGQLTDSKTKKDHVINMEDGKPYIFGSESDKVLAFENGQFHVEKYIESDSQIIHEPKKINTSIEFALAELTENEQLPAPIGVFKEEDKKTYDGLLIKQVNNVKEKQGSGDLKKLLFSGNTWEIK